MTRYYTQADCDDDVFTKFLSWVIDNISPKLSLFRDITTDFQAHARDSNSKEKLNIEERTTLDSDRRGENEHQTKLSVRKRKRANVLMSPSDEISESRFTYSTPRKTEEAAPDIGSMARPSPTYSSSTPLYQPRNIPGEDEVAHGYLVNTINEDTNDFTRTSEIQTCSFICIGNKVKSQLI